jgi:hypothetical protein
MRQQLDELDHLLQRMLSLPASQLEDAGEVVLPAPTPALAEKPAARPIQQAEAHPSKAALSPALERLKEKAPLPGDTQAPAVVRKEPPAKPRGPLVIYQPMNAPSMLTACPPIADKPVPKSTPASQEFAAPNWGPAVETLPAPSPEPPAAESLPPLPEPRSPFLERHQARLRKQRESAPPLRPVDWFNSFFDRLAIALGGPFLWLIRPEARSLVGWIGIALLFVALLILAGDWLGWSWPS